MSIKCVQSQKLPFAEKRLPFEERKEKITWVKQEKDVVKYNLGRRLVIWFVSVLITVYFINYGIPIIWSWIIDYLTSLHMSIMKNVSDKVMRLYRGQNQVHQQASHLDRIAASKYALARW
jgi:hypothetical protein